jgi:phage recombination protein Bet
MSTALATQAGGALALSEEELIGVLTSSLYPGANIASIKMVLGYCKAAGLDPMQKPVHIVPMWDGKAKQMRDVVMPGVGLYRTQASRTGTFAGQSEPEFGPMVTTRLGGVEITYPEFAKVTVKKTMANGTVADFTAVEYWIENYAVKGGAEKSVAPNAMWMKRPRGQIAKCAAAQALRLAFPEMGAQPTAEEMEGKSLQDDAPAAHAAPEVPAELIRAADEAAVKGVAAYQAFWSEAGAVNRKLLAAGHEMRKSLAAKADADRTVDAVPASEHEDVSA